MQRLQLYGLRGSFGTTVWFAWHKLMHRMRCAVLWYGVCWRCMTFETHRQDVMLEAAFSNMACA
jgi:hypothetical protein